MSVYNVLAQLASTPSRNEKIAILEKNKDVPYLKEVLNLALCPLTQFYIRKIPAYNKHGFEYGLEWAIPQLERLSSRALTGNAAITHLGMILSSLSVQDAVVVKLIIEKDLKCGVQESTVNKVFPKLIHDYPVMLASAFDEKLVSKIKFPAYVQKKEDGMRFNAIVRNGVVEYRSRNGKSIAFNQALVLDEVFVKLANGKDYVFDGELLVADSSGKPLDRKTGNGILNKSVKGTISVEESAMVRASLWDTIPYEDFIVEKCDIPYNIRLTYLENRISSLGNLSNMVSLTDTHTVDDIESVRKLFDQYLKARHEGIILKSKTGKWENTRSKDSIKFKAELVCELLCEGIEPGTGKYEGMVGSLICRSRDGAIKVNVGSGLTDEDRRADFYTGNIISVKYNARIDDKKTGIHSLFLPIFLEVRLDKDTADHSKDIK